MPLALYFSENDTCPRVLEEQNGHVWVIGRPTEGKRPDIAFTSGEVSKQHAAIRCIEDGSIVSWQIKHRGTNKTYRVRRGIEDELPFDIWLPIEDGDQYYFVRKSMGFTATTDLDETLNNIPFETDDRDRTVNQTLEDAIAESKAIQQAQYGRTLPDAIAELGKIMIDGPEGVHKILWRIFLTAATLFAVWLWRR